jgi:predicted XRE-type DNA-binding protein
MRLNDWGKEVLKPRDAKARVEQIRHELRLAADLRALREETGLSQREVAERIGVSQPRVAASSGARI